MTIAFLFILLFALIFFGMPIAISLGLASITTILLFSHDSLGSIALKFFCKFASNFWSIFLSIFEMSNFVIASSTFALNLLISILRILLNSFKIALMSLF